MLVAQWAMRLCGERMCSRRCLGVEPASRRNDPGCQIRCLSMWLHVHFAGPGPAVHHVIISC
jgi:hypothetical protein